MDYTVILDFYLSDQFKPIAFYPIKNNGCCDKKFFILTANKCRQTKERPTGINYSCQCACGIWCTNGHASEQGAVNEYRMMCERKQKEDKQYEINRFNKCSGGR